MARSLPGTMIDLARGAIASLGSTTATEIADYVIVSIGADRTVELHTSLCCAEHARWLLFSVEFSDDQCDMTGESRWQHPDGATSPPWRSASTKPSRPKGN